jgi:hypothetical protein
LWLALSFLPAVLAQHVQLRRLLLTLVVSLVLASIAVVRIQWSFESGRRSTVISRVVLISICIVGAAVSAFFYFEEVRVEECNLHVGHTEMALFVRETVGNRFVYVYAEDDTDRATIDDYVILAAYDELADAVERGVSVGDLLEMVGPSQLDSVVKDDRSIDRKVRLVTTNDVAGDWDVPESLRSQMARFHLAASRHGNLVFWDWRPPVAATAMLEAVHEVRRSNEVERNRALDDARARTGAADQNDRRRSSGRGP